MSKMPQDRKMIKPKTDGKNLKEKQREETDNPTIKNEPSAPDQIGSSVVRRDEPDDED